MSKFSEIAGKGLGEVKLSTRNPILTGNGSYDLTVHKVIGSEYRGGGLYMVAEFDVEKSTNPNYPEGSRVSYFLDFVKFPEMAKQRLLEFLIQGFGMDRGEAETAITTEALTGAQNVLAGEKVRCVTTEAKSKNGKTYTAFRWVQVQVK